MHRDATSSGMPRIAWLLTLMAALMVWQDRSLAQPAAPSSAASELMKKRQYLDAIRVLQGEIAGKPDNTVAHQLLMLGECHFMSRQYAEAGKAFERAFHNLADEAEKTIAEYRLACVAFRLGKPDEASTRIDVFLAAHPNDARVGKLLGYKMLILSAKGKAAEAQMEELHKKIYANIDAYDAITGVEADQILCDFYRRTGSPNKAEALYRRIVLNFRQVIAERQKDRLPIPAAVEKAHDNAALQLGIIALEAGQGAEAAKWLENVRYDQDAKVRARLLLAKISYEKQDYSAAIAHLTGGEFIETVPAGAIKSDMYLVLGMSEKARNGSAGKIEEYLRKVGSDSSGFQQAQLGLGDIYREKGLLERAIDCYRNALSNPDYAPSSLYNLATIYVEQARQLASDPPKAKVLHTEAAKLLGQLYERYPLSQFAKQAKALVEQLAGKVDVSFAQDADELIKGWEKIAASKPGTLEAAQSLMSLVRHHAKRVMDEKAKRFIKAPDYVACASACDKLLDEKKYSGQGFDNGSWKFIRGEVLYYRGICELASLGADAADAGAGKPKYLPKPTAAAAVDFLSKAKPLIDPKQLDLVKTVELALLEALFKSDRAQDREAAEKRFMELEADYGNDPRFQRLAVDLGEWYQQQGRWADAAKAYMGVADRGRDLAEEESMRLLYSAGTLWSRAAYEAQQKPGNTGYCIYIYPKEAVDLGGNVLKEYAPLQKPVDIVWPNKGNNILATEALFAISKAANIPFRWPTERGPETIASYLESKRLNLGEGGRYTVDKALEAVLDLRRHRLDYDSGLCDGNPSITPKADSDDPEAEKPRIIEIYDASQTYSRYAPMTRAYGQWERVHGGRTGGAMLYNVMTRIEEITRTRAVWADVFDQEARELKRAFTYNQAPTGVGHNSTCAQVLAAALDAAGLRFKIAQREAAADYYDAAKDAFNKIRKINPGSKFGEKALFAVAINFYNLKEYQKMRLVLREYLKTFDNPSNEFWHEANFWVGWALENERKYREACTYYARAAEEFLTIYKPSATGKLPSREDLRKKLSYDAQYALSEKIGGDFKDFKLTDLAEFMRINTHVTVRIDATAAGTSALINRMPFKGVVAFDVLCDALEPLGLSFKVGNVNAKAAERAYYRMAWVYRKDNMMEQALENCVALLERYPETTRRRDAQKLMLDVYRSMRKYREALATLQELRSAAADDAEKTRLQVEMAWIHLDNADYEGALKLFAQCLTDVKMVGDVLAVREGYARALWRSNKLAEALNEYETLARSDHGELRRFVYKLAVFYLKLTTGKDKVEEHEFPEEADRYVQNYEKLSDNQRAMLTPADLARATWVYYIRGLMDVRKERWPAAIERLTAVTNSPDDWIAADAAYQLSLIQLRNGRPDKAREELENLLVGVRSAEAAVRATYALGAIHEKLKEPAKAVARWRELVERYPLSPYVEQVKKNALYQEWLKTGATRPTTVP